MVTRVNETLSKITGTSTKPRNEGRVASRATEWVTWFSGCVLYMMTEKVSSVSKAANQPKQTTPL